MRQATEIRLNAVVIGELLAGFRRGAHRARNERELGELLSSPRVRAMPLDEETAERYAAILESLRGAGTPIPMNDIWIAATAMQHGLTVVTTDARYEKVPQILVKCFPA